MTHGVRLAIGISVLLAAAAVGGAVWHLKGVIAEWVRAADVAERDRKQQEQLKRDLARGNRMVDINFPAAPRRRAFVSVTDTPQPLRPELRANGLHINSVSRDPRRRNATDVVVSVTNEGDRAAPFPFAWSTAVEDPSPKIGWDSPSEQSVERAAAAFKDGRRNLGDEMLIGPGQTVDLVIELGVRGTREPSHWLTFLAFKPELVTDCDCVVVQASSPMFYKYLPR